LERGARAPLCTLLFARKTGPEFWKFFLGAGRVGFWEVAAELVVCVPAFNTEARRRGDAERESGIQNREVGMRRRGAAGGRLLCGRGLG
jgi:hypothetical protein